jgi:hypothetical protein
MVVAWTKEIKSLPSRPSDGTLWLLLSHAVLVCGDAEEKGLCGSYVEEKHSDIGAHDKDEVVNGEKGAGELLVLLSPPIYGGARGIVAEIVGSATPTIQPLPPFPGGNDTHDRTPRSATIAWATEDLEAYPM